MKLNFKNKVILIFLIMLFLPVIAMANEQFIFPEYTEEYKKWVELPDDEKANYIQPQMFEKMGEISENDVQTFSIDVDNSKLTASKLPSRFARADYGNVKNQGSTNACWAYSAATVFDTNYYITNGTKKTFSNLHMDYATSQKYNETGFNRTTNSGGNIQIALAYATNGMGIALESDMPENKTLSTITAVPANSKVSDYVNLYDIEQTKNYIYNYGVVSAATYIGNSQYFSSSEYYENDNLAYYCTNVNLLPNHAVTIVGWDDNYTNSSFPDQTGAFIVLNSYGKHFGNNGLYYIFYNDIFVQQALFGVTKTDTIDYDNIYQYDEYGCIAEVGFQTTYAANVFTRKNQSVNEKLTEISAYFPEAGQATIYINAKNNNVSIGSATYTQSTYIGAPGYHTIKLNNTITLENDKFVVGIKYPGIMGIEMNTNYASDWCYTATSNSGESYVSPNGQDYQELQTLMSSQFEVQYSNVCIKAFTENIEIVKEENFTTTITPTPEYTADLANYVFDYKYYADHNLDIYAVYGYNQAALKQHWNLYGKAEGRKSSPILDLTYYVANNADVRKAFNNNYVAAYNHFMNYGYAEFRASSSEYFGTYYKNNNADLKNMTSIQLIRHYSLYGKSELRLANTNYDVVSYLFDPIVYAEANPDVKSAFGNNTAKLREHWYKYGITEGRVASLIFDARSYLKLNKDVANAFGGQNYKAAYDHFVNYGFKEGRQGNNMFNIKYYLSQNKDVKSAYGTNYLKTANHFVNYGKNEPRLTSSSFNVAIYRNKNADLRIAYQENYAKYFIHYLSYGQYENRICK